MRIYSIVFLIILVVVRGTNSFKEHEMALAEYTEEDSRSESNEVTDKVQSREANITNSAEKVVLSVEDIATENINKDESVSLPCDKQVKSDEDRSATTLVNYPFAVSVLRKGAHYTTGALLDKWWILTTAGEFFNVRESIKLFGARLGSVDCKKGGTKVPIKRIEIHPSYVKGQPNFDLSLLRIAQPVDYTDFIRPIGLSKIKKKVISAKFMTTYWPTLIIDGKPLPQTANERIKQNSMRVSTQRLIPRERCLYHLKDYDKIHESTLCLKPIKTHHSVCKPDAGAPLVAEDGLWGITSGWTSRKCEQKPSPTVFTRISAPQVRSWLDSKMLEME